MTKPPKWNHSFPQPWYKLGQQKTPADPSNIAPASHIHQLPPSESESAKGSSRDCFDAHAQTHTCASASSAILLNRTSVRQKQDWPHACWSTYSQNKRDHNNQKHAELWETIAHLAKHCKTIQPHSHNPDIVVVRTNGTQSGLLWTHNEVIIGEVSENTSIKMCHHKCIQSQEAANRLIKGGMTRIHFKPKILRTQRMVVWQTCRSCMVWDSPPSSSFV